ncbi:phage head closure protein [Ollibium composti]|uniref:Head-tail adaptor protein n=1 Tax=Ollibium composti TaxID=2675109 RepID=A0ABY2Q7T7_9HYPH|nr:phage head closure protein [Mesorhizobium composti]THF56666.1 head-tail adaptor protein [Mesorhizobium composti]
MGKTFVDPGALRTRLVLQTVTAVPDDLGGFAENWSDVATVFARIEPVSADSRFGAGQTLEAVTHCITLRHRGDVEADMRLAGGGRFFLIVTAHDPDESGRYLLCRTRETTI